jgi:hypothetical protein
MATLIRVGIFSGFAFLAGVGVIVALHMISGRIPLAGLLDSKGADGQPSFSPARLQMLIFTMVVAARYLFMVISHPTAGALPTLPQGVVAALGGSQAFYLGGKAFTTYVEPILKKLK